MSSDNHFHTSSFDQREHVRKRPGMYFGGIDKKALHTLIWNVIEDAISEFEGTSTHRSIRVILLPDKRVQIEDNGSGLPVDIIPAIGMTGLEAHMSRWSRDEARRKNLSPETYQVSTSFFSYNLMPAVNALSSQCLVESKRDGFLWRQRYSEGLPIAPLEKFRSLEIGEATGTSIAFQPDFSILDENDFDFELIANHCNKLAYLLPQLSFTVQDKREIERQLSFYYPQGLVEWVSERAKNEKAVTEVLSISYDYKSFDTYNRSYPIKVHQAFQWLDGEKQVIGSFANTVETQEGGSHLIGLITALCNQLGIRNWQSLKPGFVGIIHILHYDPQFESQTSIRLINSDVVPAIDEAVEALFAAHSEAKAAIQAHFGRR